MKTVHIARVPAWWALIALAVGIAVGIWVAPSLKTSGAPNVSVEQPIALPKLQPLPKADHVIDNEHVRHVWPGTDIQKVLEAAAADSAHKVVRVYEGVYRPKQAAQAMIYLNARHEGITLQADGEVVLAAVTASPVSSSFHARTPLETYSAPQRNESYED